MFTVLEILNKSKYSPWYEVGVRKIEKKINKRLKIDTIFFSVSKIPTGRPLSKATWTLNCVPI